MNFPRNLPRRIFSVTLIIVFAAELVSAQQARGTLRGLILTSWARHRGRQCNLTVPVERKRRPTTNGEGVYNLPG